MPSYYFVIVGSGDRPLYELNCPPLRSSGDGDGGGGGTRSYSRAQRAPEAGGGGGGSAFATTALSALSLSSSSSGTKTTHRGGGAGDGTDTGELDNDSARSAAGAVASYTTLPGAPKFNRQHLNQFVLHAALDVVDECSWSTRDMYLRNIDRYNDLVVSALLTPHIGTRFMLVHDTTDEASKAGRQFLHHVYEVYVLCVLCNPLREPNEPVSSVAFHERVLRLAKKYLA